MRNFGNIQHKADKLNRFSIDFFYCDVHYDGDSFNRFTSGKRNLSKCNISIISYLTSGSPAQTKGLDCLCYCEPRTLKQTALSIMGTCVTASQVHCCIYISFLMCIKLFRKKTKKQGFLWGILATFNTKQTNSTDFLSTFFIVMFITMGTHLTDLLPVKEIYQSATFL